MIAAGEALRRVLSVNFVNLGQIVSIDPPVSRDWASITFTGQRHAVRLRLDGASADRAADAFLDGLAEREFDLRGHILIDIACVGDARDAEGVTLELEALTVEAD